MQSNLVRHECRRVQRPCSLSASRVRIPPSQSPLFSRHQDTNRHNSFRVNEAHGRYQRGLAEWDEGVGTALPSLALQIGRLFEPGTWHPGDRARLFGLLAAFPVALKRSLRREAVAPELSRLLGPADAGRVVSGGPACVLDVVNAYVLSAAREHGPVGQCLAGRLLALTGRLALAANRCESIASYAVTYGYLAHLRLFMGCWILLLPFALVQECGWFTVAIVPVVAYGILGMEAIAEELTEPFVRG